jgi:hypothetical protein
MNKSTTVDDRTLYIAANMSTARHGSSFYLSTAYVRPKVVVHKQITCRTAKHESRHREKLFLVFVRLFRLVSLVAFLGDYFQMENGLLSPCSFLTPCHCNHSP